MPFGDRILGKIWINEYVTDVQPNVPPAQAASRPIFNVFVFFTLLNSSSDVITYGGLQTTEKERKSNTILSAGYKQGNRP